MIMYPLSELMKRVDCRYTLVIVAAKRARMLTEHKQVSPLDNFDPEDNSQPVSYTHLDVYKRQFQASIPFLPILWRKW